LWGGWREAPGGGTRAAARKKSLAEVAPFDMLLVARIPETFLANETARALRKRLTPQEVKLWVKLRELKPLGFRFRRQTPIGSYIVDFVSFASRLVIEADGGQHNMASGIRSDQARDDFLRSQGFRVLRFWNSDIDANLEGVMEAIFTALKERETE
jgi:very-short-patch-repair endonuclease